MLFAKVLGLKLLNQFADRCVSCRGVACDPPVCVYKDRCRCPSSFHLLGKLALFLQKNPKLFAELFDIRRYRAAADQNDLELVRKVLVPLLYLRQKCIARAAVRTNKQKEYRLPRFSIIGQSNTLSAGICQFKF